MSGRTVEAIERDLGRAGRHLKVAADELADAGRGDAAAFVGTLASLADGTDLHQVGAHVWLSLAGMDPLDRSLAFGAIFDVARVVRVAGEPADEPAVGELVGFLEQMGTVYPAELRSAVTSV